MTLCPLHRVELFDGECIPCSFDMPVDPALVSNAHPAEERIGFLEQALDALLEEPFGIRLPWSAKQYEARSKARIALHREQARERDAKARLDHQSEPVTLPAHLVRLLLVARTDEEQESARLALWQALKATHVANVSWVARG
jgi:hypothetical protein